MDISGISAVASSSGTSGTNTNTNDYMDKLADKIIAQKDADGDGYISIEEAKLPKEIFSFIDRDGNNKVDKTELKNASGQIQNSVMSLSELLIQSDKGPAPDKLQSLMSNLKNANSIASTAKAQETEQAEASN